MSNLFEKCPWCLILQLKEQNALVIWILLVLAQHPFQVEYSIQIGDMCTETYVEDCKVFIWYQQNLMGP